MEEYVTIYDHEGWPLAEVEPAGLARSWVLGEIGTGELELPRTDPKLNADLIRYGNLISIHSDVVPLWGGVILPPTTITPAFVRFSIYSGEALLQNRAISLATSQKGSPGATFRKVLKMVQREYQCNLIPGDITESTRKISVVEPWRDAWDLTELIVEKSGEEFYVEPFIRNERLWFQAHWMPRIGKNRTKEIAFMEGHNISANFSIEETGELVDELVVVGKGDDPQTRPSVRRSLPDHAGLFGIWCHIIDAYDLEEIDELSALAEKEINNYGLPDFRLLLELLNVSNSWQEFDIGDTVGLDLVSYQYSPSYLRPTNVTVRVLGRSFDIMEGKMPVVVESYTDEAFEEGIGK